MGIAKRKSFELPPEGLHPAICIDSIDLGMVENQFSHKMQEKVKFVWELSIIDDEGEPVTRKDGLPFRVSRMYTLSLDPRATLRAHLEAWRGRKFTPEEERGFDTENVVGKACQVQVVHDQSRNTGDTYANVSGVVPLGRGMEKPIYPDTYIRVKDRPTEEDDMGPAPESEQEYGDSVPF